MIFVIYYKYIYIWLTSYSLPLTSLRCRRITFFCVLKISRGSTSINMALMFLQEPHLGFLK
ncbi:hypothetical protein Hanom_Chr16g01502641 [Helianthus anomalus]